MVKSLEITKVSIRDRLVVDAKVSMKDPQDYDFSPRASISGTTLSLVNESGDPSSTFELDAEQAGDALQGVADLFDDGRTLVLQLGAEAWQQS